MSKRLDELQEALNGDVLVEGDPEYSGPGSASTC